MIVYHRTDAASHAAILASRGFKSREQGEVCVSDVRDGYATGYGEYVITLDVPDEMLTLDDQFQTGERHYRINSADIRPEYIRNA